MRKISSLEDIIGIEHSKLGFYQELQQHIIKLKETNRKLDERQNEIEALLNGLTDMMLVLTKELTILRTNHVFRNFFADKKITGTNCYQLLAERDEPCNNCPVLTALQTSSTVKASLIHEINKKFYHFDVIATPLELAGMKTVQVFYRDTTHDKKIQAKYNQAEKMATVGALAAGVAHEINNPLSAIQGFAEGIRRRLHKIEGSIDKEILNDFQEYTDIILGECSRCSTIVRTLLSFSRPQAASLSPIDINKSIQDTLFLFKHRLQEKPRLCIKLDLAENLPLIAGDEAQLKQVIINLYSNGVDAIDNQGTLHITTRRSKRNKREGIEFTVKDSGCGIVPGIREKLFEPFFTTKPIGKGVGIGLSTCYTIVNNHQGEISVESETGRGAAFTVFLPETRS